MDARRTLASIALASCLCLWLGRVPSSFAHAVEFPKRDALRVTRDRLTLQVQYVVSPSDEAQVLRRLFDRDRSGALDAPEKKELLAHLARQATAFVRLVLDGRQIPLALENAELGDDSASADIVLSAPLVEKLTPGRHQLRLFDRHKDRRVMVPVRVFADALRVRSALPPLTLLSFEKSLDLELEISAD